MIKIPQNFVEHVDLIKVVAIDLEHSLLAKAILFVVDWHRATRTNHNSANIIRSILQTKSTRIYSANLVGLF